MRTVLFMELVTLSLMAGCTTGTERMPDAGSAEDGGADAGPLACACEPGDHERLIYMISDDAEVWSYDPVSNATDFIGGPICGGVQPFSMAVDGRGVGWVLSIDSLGMQNIDLLDPGPCTDSGYLRRDERFGLFGMSFATRSATDPCAELFVQTFSGGSAYREGPDLGWLGAIDPDTLELRAIAPIDFDGGELSGTGDGRLFSFAGTDPVKLTEYDRDTGAMLEQLELPTVRRQNASAMAFFGGDLYLFTEAVPEGCEECLVGTCEPSLSACREDAVCADHLGCAIATANITDDCGGYLPKEMMSCLVECGDPCLVVPRARVSTVVRFDLDASGGARGFETVVERLPIRVVGAASSPCVPTGPI